MTLEQSADLLKRIEEKVIEKHGHFHTKTAYRQGVRYFASIFDAAYARDLYASWLLMKIVRRQDRERRRQVRERGYVSERVPLLHRVGAQECAS